MSGQGAEIALRNWLLQLSLGNMVISMCISHVALCVLLHHRLHREPCCQPRPRGDLVLSSNTPWRDMHGDLHQSQSRHQHDSGLQW
jgi:hypothetical protein